ncbi:MAG: lipopolysaccharide biosynthesis protein [Solirubrobacteraceae bacterium]
MTIWLAFLGLLTTPYLLHQLGRSFYGVFALITIMTAYLSNLELGFGGATVRFLARARGRGDEDEERRVLGTSLAVFLVAATLAGVIALLASAFIAGNFVRGSDALHEQALDAIRIGALILSVSLISSFAGASLQALGRFQVVLGTRVVFGTMSSAGAVTAVATGGGLRTVLGVQGVISVALCLVLLVALTRATTCRLRPSFDRKMLRSMAGFGGLVLLAGLAYQVILQGPPSVLAGHAPTSELAAFAVPSTILQQLIVLGSATSLGFLSFASAASADEDRSQLAAVFRANVRLTLLAMGPVAAFLIVFGRPLLSTWIDAGFAADAVGPLRWLAIAALMISLSAPVADVARGLGRPAWVVWFTVVAAALALGGSFALVSGHGAAGVAGAMAIALVATVVPFAIIVGWKLLSSSPRWLAGAMARPVAAVALCALAFVIGSEASSSFASVIVTGALVTTAYLALAFRFVLDDRERAALRRPGSARARLRREAHA